MSTVIQQELPTRPLAKILEEYMENERDIIAEGYLFESYVLPNFDEKKLFLRLQQLHQSVGFGVVSRRVENELSKLGQTNCVDLSHYTIEDPEDVKKLAEFIRASHLIDKIDFPRDLICDIHHLELLADAICANRNIGMVIGFVDVNQKVAKHIIANQERVKERIAQIESYFKNYFQIDLIIARIRENDPTVTQLNCLDYYSGWGMTLLHQSIDINFLDPKNGNMRIFALFGALSRNQHLLSIDFGLPSIDLDQHNAKILVHALENNKSLVNICNLTAKGFVNEALSNNWNARGRSRDEEQFDLYWQEQCNGLRPILRRNRFECAIRILQGTLIVDKTIPYFVKQTPLGLELDIDHPVPNGDQWKTISQALTHNNGNVVKIRLWLVNSAFVKGYLYSFSNEDKTAFQHAVCENVMTYGNVMLREIQSCGGIEPKVEDDPQVKQCLKLTPSLQQVFESDYGTKIVIHSIIGITLQYCFFNSKWPTPPIISPSTLSHAPEVEITNTVDTSERKRTLEPVEINNEDDKEKADRETQSVQTSQRAMIRKLKDYREAFMKAEVTFQSLRAEGRQFYTPQASNLSSAASSSSSSVSTPSSASTTGSALLLSAVIASGAGLSSSSSAASATVAGGASSSASASATTKSKGSLMDRMRRKKDKKP